MTTPGRLTLDEKVSLMIDARPRGPARHRDFRGGQALHGVARRPGHFFPQAIALAAAWDTDLMLTWPPGSRTRPAP
jgi:beta-glucosidase-like glycosyl hydrolase